MVKGWRWLVVILAASLLFKWIVWHWVAASDPTRLLRPDSSSYIASARALWLTGHFAISPAEPSVPQTFRTPGYPAYLAVVYALTGRTDEATSALTQLFLSLVTIVLVFWIGERLWNRQVATLAAALLAFDLASFAYSLLLMSETLFTLLLMLALVALVLLQQPGQRRRPLFALLVGILLAAATLVRPVSYYLIVPLTLGVLWLGWQGGWPQRTVAGCVMALLVPYLVLIGGWQVRNYLRTGEATFSTVVANNLLFYRGAGVVALRDGVPLTVAQDQLRREVTGKSGAALTTYMRQRGLALLRAYPGLALRTEINGALTMMLGLGDGWLTMLLYAAPNASSAAWDLLRLRPQDYLATWIAERPLAFVAFWLSLVQLMTVYAGSVLWWLGVVRRQLKFAPIDLLLWGIVVYLILVSAGPEANSRFRVPIMPILALYAAAGLCAVPRLRWWSPRIVAEAKGCSTA